ncbi:MAG: hypothetical protein SH856_03080 [Flavobacteriales bacterium]|nr:hypothetical protein [Flavobacteriales bacterium]
MKLKITFIALAFLALVVNTFAQRDIPLTVEAIELWETDIEGARKLIDRAVETEQESKHPYAWYTRGYIYKEIFKQVDMADKNSINRDIAVECIERCISLDPIGVYAEQCELVLEYIANSYWQHTSEAIELFSTHNSREPEMFYAGFKRIFLLFRTEAELRDKQIAFYKALAQAHANIYLQDVYDNVVFINQAIGYYIKALEQDSLDYEANYNVATAYYNQGVHILRTIGPQTTIDDLIIIQDQCVQLFTDALPYMLKAHGQRPDRQETLKGLYIIYRALSDDAQQFFYKEELERMSREGLFVPNKMDQNKSPDKKEDKRED